MLNQCNFIGRVGRDPEERFTNSGKLTVRISIACSEKRKSEERVEWVNVVFWEKLAQIVVQYVRKGALLFVSGKIQTRSWEDKEGVKRSTTEIVANDMKMLDSKGQAKSEGTYSAAGNTGAGDGPDDVPF